VDDDGDPIHAISLKIISRVVDGAGALAGNTHGTAGVDETTEDDGEDEACASALSPEASSSTTGADATLDCAIATLFFAEDGDGAGVCDAAATLAFATASSLPTGIDDDALSAPKRSLSEMVLIPALFIPSALLIAKG
jgi:hypothetical protein